MQVILYSTHCPKCNVLIKKLKDANVEYEEVTDINEMSSLGIKQVPMLKLKDKLLNFTEANNWINELKENK